MHSHSHIPLTLLITTITTISLIGCAKQNSEGNAIRRAVLAEVLGQEQIVPDELIIRLGEGESRDNFGFPETTTFLIGPVREKEYWQVRDPLRTYLFIGDIIYSEDHSRATVDIEFYFGENALQKFELTLQKSDRRWDVVSRADPS